jgi:hypothetical protein
LSNISDGRGGDGGSARISGCPGIAEGGDGGRGGVPGCGYAGKGGDAIVDGRFSAWAYAKGGDGGEAGQRARPGIGKLGPTGPEADAIVLGSGVTLRQWMLQKGLQSAQSLRRGRRGEGGYGGAAPIEADGVQLPPGRLIQLLPEEVVAEVDKYPVPTVREWWGKVLELCPEVAKAVMQHVHHELLRR